MDLTDKRLDLERDGYIAIADLLTEQEVAWYLECYEAILSGEIDAGQWRSDLASGMLIDKAPGTDAPTPFHPDMAYWVDLPDRRAVSCWIALDEATVDNGGVMHYSRGNTPAGHRRALIINFRPGQNRTMSRAPKWIRNVGMVERSSGRFGQAAN